MDYDFYMIDVAIGYIMAGKKEEGTKLLNEVLAYSMEYLEHIMSIPENRRFGLDYAAGINIQTLIEIYSRATELGMEELKTLIEPDLNRFYSALIMAGQR